MTLLQLTNVTCEGIANLSFALDKGEIAVARPAGREGESTLLELMLGEKMPEEGSIFLRGRPLADAAPGYIGWVPANGGLISNLKIWENITLPLWYHGKYQPRRAEETVRRWLDILKLDKDDWGDFMASQPALLEMWERKLAGLLRGLVQSPALLVVDGAVFGGIAHEVLQHWMKALELFALEAEERAVLVITDQAALLPWRKIE